MILKIMTDEATIASPYFIVVSGVGALQRSIELIRLV